MTKKTLIVAAALVTTAGSAAMADTITARYTYNHSQNINITSPARNGSTPTVSFHWTRQDAPGIGVDSLIPNTFDTFCVDLAQTVTPSTNHTYDVVTGAAHGFTSQQETLLTNLWGTYKSAVTDSTTSAAFQIAIWEIVYDTNHDVDTGPFRMSGNNAVKNTAQGWLDSITAPGFVYTGPALVMRVLESDCLQDQVTFVSIPAPSAAAAGLMGLGLAARRRRS